MKKSLLKVAAFALTIVVCICSVAAASASMRSSLYLDSYRAWLSPGSDGVIYVCVDVQAVTTMDEVGASKIQVYESTDGGDTWESVRVYVKSLYPEMVVEDDYWYYDDPIAYQGVAGRQYYAVVTAYAADSTGFDEKQYTTAIVTARR